jgi:hypothetical protein
MICTSTWGEKKCWTLKSDQCSILFILHNANNWNLFILRLSIFYVLNIQFKLMFDHIGGKDFLCSTGNLIEIDKDTVEKVMHGGLSWMWKWKHKQVDIPRMRPATSSTPV